MGIISKDLGPVTAYAAAVNRGYTGTREEFETLMASYATVAEQAGESASHAAESAGDAESFATEAAASASNASGSASAAVISAGNASSSASAAQSAQEVAESARNAAQIAQTAAEEAREGAEIAVAGFDTIVIAAINDVSAASTNQKELAKRQAQKSEAWAVGQHNGQDVGASDPAYHNNAKYYAESVGTAATTATTKASEAAQSAENAAASASAAAQSAQSLVIDDTLSRAGQVADAKAVGDKIKESGNELFQISGYVNQNYVKGRKRYVDAGVEKFGNRDTWISPAQGEYIELKSGDVIVNHKSRYHFRVCYSTDNKVTWIMSAEQVTRFSMPSDAIGWISIIAATTATDEDVETILNEHVIEIIRNGVNLVGSINANVNGVMDALNISPNIGFQIKAIKDGTTFVYINTTATLNGGTEKLFEIPCAKDDVFRLTFDFQAMWSPENFNEYTLIVREIDQDEASPLRNVQFNLSELQTAADFTVYYANTKKIIANVILKRSGATVSSSYYEEIKYAITAIKILEQNDVYTEAGEAWEV